MKILKILVVVTAVAVAILAAVVFWGGADRTTGVTPAPLLLPTASPQPPVAIVGEVRAGGGVGQLELAAGPEILSLTDPEVTVSPPIDPTRLQLGQTLYLTHYSDSRRVFGVVKQTAPLLLVDDPQNRQYSLDQSLEITRIEADGLTKTTKKIVDLVPGDIVQFKLDDKGNVISAGQTVRLQVRQGTISVLQKGAGDWLISVGGEARPLVVTDQTAIYWGTPTAAERPRDATRQTLVDGMMVSVSYFASSGQLLARSIRL